MYHVDLWECNRNEAGLGLRIGEMPFGNEFSSVDAAFWMITRALRISLAVIRIRRFPEQ